MATWGPNEERAAIIKHLREAAKLQEMFGKSETAESLFSIADAIDLGGHLLARNQKGASQDLAESPLTDHEKSLLKEMSARRLARSAARGGK